MSPTGAAQTNFKTERLEYIKESNSTRNIPTEHSGDINKWTWDQDYKTC